MKSFEALGVSHGLIKGLKELNIVEPSPIQAQVIPLLLDDNKDLVGQAQTGTGKTAAYGLPLLMEVNPAEKHIQGLILCPTRELGQQVAKQLFKFTKYTEKIFVESVYGGEKIDVQMSRLARPTHIVVATPGRLIDLVKRKAIDIRKVKTVVLDEADEMLSMGFKDQLHEILSGLPSREHTWLFSATMPGGIQDIVRKHISEDAHQIRISKQEVVNKSIDHQYIACDDDQKLFALISLIKSEHMQQGIVFCRTKSTTQKLTKQLIAKNVSADCLHGDMQQKEREKVMRAFKNGKVQVLVATDIAARGLDIQDLAYVAHFELPESDEFYTHRSGRTARAGKQGLSLVLANPKEISILKNYERTLRIGFKKIQPIKR